MFSNLFNISLYMISFFSFISLAIMISSEMPEILGMSDRILVLSEGKLSGEFDRQEASQEKILKRAVNTEEV